MHRASIHHHPWRTAGRTNVPLVGGRDERRLFTPIILLCWSRNSASKRDWNLEARHKTRDKTIDKTRQGKARKEKARPGLAWPGWQLQGPVMVAGHVAPCKSGQANDAALAYRSHHARRRGVAHDNEHNPYLYCLQYAHSQIEAQKVWFHGS